MGDTSQIQAMVVAAAQRYSVDPNVALGIAAHESGFNPNATHLNPNGTTDWGVMQLNDTTVQTMGVSNPLDPQQNIDAGVRLLSSLVARYGGDYRNALWAYASGPGNVGPGKTPNTIAANFIQYVLNYRGGPPPATPGSDSPPQPPDSGPTGDSGAPAGDIPGPTDDSGGSGVSQASSIDWNAVILAGLIGLAVLWLVDSDLF